MLLAIGAAFACQPTLLARFPAPAAPPAALSVQTTALTVDGTTYTGAEVTVRSAWRPTDWKRVLEHPELQDDWHPKEIGTERVERIEGTDFYQRTAISVLGFTVRRQIIARVHWNRADENQLSTCWSAGVPAEFTAKVAAWSDSSPWQDHGFGAWRIDALPEGGSAVAYQVWVDTHGVPAPLVAWAVSRTLPTLLTAFEARVATLAASP